MSLVSVIIPNYNNAFWLGNCIESCLEQGKYLREIIIVDDNSEDESVSIINDFEREYPGVVNGYSNPSKGANQARNFGFSKSSGKVIQWLDSDDQLLPGKFENQVPVLLKEDTDIVFSDWRIDYWDDGIKIKSQQKIHGPYDDFMLELIKDNWTSPNNYLMTRDIATKLDHGVGWNPETRVGQDREYFTMAAIKGAEFGYVPGTFAVYNKGRSGTISGIDFKRRLELNQVLENRFRKEIKRSKTINPVKKKTYLSILDTHLLKACFYHPGIKLQNKISFFSIQWSLMHWKMRMVMPFIYLQKHFQLLI